MGRVEDEVTEAINFGSVGTSKRLALRPSFWAQGMEEGP